MIKCKVCDGLLCSYEVRICGKCMSRYYPRVTRNWGAVGTGKVVQHEQVVKGEQ